MLRKLYIYLLIRSSIFKYIHNNNNNNILTKKNFSFYLFYSFYNFFSYNNNLFFKNYILSNFFKHFFLFNNFFINLSFFKQFAINKLCKHPILKFTRKRFKYLSFNEFENEVEENKIQTDNFNFVNYTNVFNFLLKKNKKKILKNNLKKKKFFFFFLFDIPYYEKKILIFNSKLNISEKKKFTISIIFDGKNIILKNKNFLSINNLYLFNNFRNNVILLLTSGLDLNIFLKNFIIEFHKIFKKEINYELILNFINFFNINSYIDVLQDFQNSENSENMLNCSYCDIEHNTNFSYTHNKGLVNFIFFDLFSEIFFKKLVYNYDLYSLYKKNDLIIFLVFFFSKNYNFCNKFFLNNNNEMYVQNKKKFFNYKFNEIWNNGNIKFSDFFYKIENQLNILYEIQDTEINNNIFILELEINNLFFFKLNNNVFDFLKTFFFFKKKEIFFFYINCIEYLFNEYIIDFFFYKIILSFSFFFSFFINKKFNIYNYGRFFFCKNELFFNKYTLPIKTNYFKKINRRKLRIKFPKFNKNKLKFKKLYKLILKSFFITFKKFNLNDFFKNINSTYGFMSLNFFFLFMNSIFVEEHLVDFDHLFWDLTTHINRNVILNRLSSNTMNVEDYYIYNSHLPVLTTDLPIKQRFLKSVETLASLSLNKFHQLYFISFFESLFKKKFFVRFESNFFRRYKPETAAKLFIKGYQNFNFKILRNLHTTEFLEIIWYSFQFRDLRLLNNWLKKIMPMVKLKDHKKLIACMKLILENNSIFFRTTLGVNGFFFKIKGKISVTGNAKKRSSVIRFGNVSLSSKYLKLEYEEGEINTRVGILGYKMFLCY